MPSELRSAHFYSNSRELRGKIRYVLYSSVQAERYDLKRLSLQIPVQVYSKLVNFNDTLAWGLYIADMRIALAIPFRKADLVSKLRIRVIW
ncbi:hypothetical protein NPIL_412211 [Nephila pilipes]|uniref:Uncharacterized protein n=1 Tax=Nephila pilipes TaxID=299642 RepID=A0A8X6P1G5_NEPPI|nr:hypothetical protein NPIL_412211 [Nephila pilipes]